MPRLLLFLLVSAVASSSSGRIWAAPAVTSSTGNIAVNATTLTINGSGFDPVATNNTVVFNNGGVGTVTAASATQLTVTFSTEPATGSLAAVVMTDGQSSGAPVTVAVVEPVAQFSAGSESVNALTGAFSIPVIMSGNPSFASGASGTLVTVASGVNGPEGIAFDSVGNLYVSCSSDGSVKKGLPGGVMSTFASGFTSPGALAFDAAGNLYVADFDTGFVSKVTPAGVVSTFASGFDSPGGLAFDSAGNLYVSNGSVSPSPVNMVTPSGVVSTFATVSAAGQGLAFDTAGNLYVANWSAGTISKVTAGGVVSTFASGLSQPSALVFDSAGNLYVSQYVGVDKVTPTGVVGAFVPSAFQTYGLAFDASGNLYASNVNNVSYAGMVSKIVPAVLLPFTVSGTAVAAPFSGGPDYSNLSSNPLTLGPGQSLAYITGTLTPNPGTNRTLTVTFGAPTGAVLGNTTANTLTIVEPPASVAANTAGLPLNATSIVINGIFNSVAANNTVTFNDGAVGTVTSASATALTVTFTTPPTSLGILTATVLTNGLSTGAPVQVATVVPVVTSTTPSIVLGAPATITISGLGFDPVAANNIVTFNHGAVGKVIAASATQLTIQLTTLPTTTGALTATVTTDGESSGVPVAVAAVISIAQFSVASESVNATAGTFNIPVTLTGNPTFANGVTPTVSDCAWNFYAANFVALDAAGNLYVDDLYNPGVVSKAPAGGGGASSFASGFTNPTGLAVDSAGNLYVADSANNTVSKVTPAGVVSVFASGFNGPEGLAFDTAGNLYVANYAGNTVSKVTPGGAVSTLVSGLSSPLGLAFDTAGNLYVSTPGNGSVCEVTPDAAVSIFAAGFGVPTGLAFDSDGNLYVMHYPATGYPISLSIASGPASNGTIYFGPPAPTTGLLSKVTPSGVTSTFASGFFASNGLAADTHGNLYASETVYYDSYDTTSYVIEYSPTVTVPFTVSGTAVSNVDYSDVSSSSGYESTTLTFTSGHPTLYITGTLLPDAGAAPTLIFTLGTPSGAVLGSPSTNTLTVIEPQPSVTANTASLAINTPSIVINGNFSPVAANDTVTFNDGAVGTITSASATALTVNFATPPTNLGTLTAVVTSNGVSSGSPIQVATIVPSVTQTTTAVGLGVTTFTINGFGFDPIASHNSVVLSNGAVGTVISATSTQLTIVLNTPPNTTGNIDATVTTDGYTSILSVPVVTVCPTVQFATSGETVNSATGTFSIPVTLTSVPTFDGGAPPSVTTLVSGTSPASMAFDSVGNLYFTYGSSIDKMTPSGVISTFASGFTSASAIAFDFAGNLYVADNSAYTVSKVSRSGTVTLLASDISPINGLAVDIHSNVYVTTYDPNVSGTNAGIISKITPAGAVSTFASGFDEPLALIFDRSGNLYVANSDYTGAASIDRVSPNGTVSTFATGLSYPETMAIDGAGNIYLSQYYSDGVSKISPNGAVSSLVSGLAYPEGVALDASGNLYVGFFTYGNYTYDIAKIASTAVVPFTLGGTAVTGVDYSGIAASPLTFVNGQPTVYITGTLLPDAGTNTTLTFTLTTPTGAVLGTPTVNTLTIQEPSPSIAPSTASLAANAQNIVINGNFSPIAANDKVTFDDGAAGTVIAANATSITVNFTSPPAGLGALTATVTCKGVSTGTPVQVATVVPGVNSTAPVISLNSSTVIIYGAGFDPIAAHDTVIFNNGAVGTVTVATSTQLTVTLTTPPTSTGALTAIVTSDGLSSPLAVSVAIIDPLLQFSAASETVNATTGTFSIPVTCTGAPTFAAGAGATTSTLTPYFYYPSGLAFDSAGNLYVVEWGSSSVSKIPPGGSKTTFASGFADIGTITLDAAGNLYVADFGASKVMKVTPAGVVSTFASGISEPSGLAFDSAGNLYVSSSNYSGAIFKVTPGGIVSTFLSGLINPSCLAFDAAGNLYFANYDANNNGLVTRITPNGVASTFASGFANISALVIDPAGDLYILNNGWNSSNGNLQMVTPAGATSTLASGLYEPGSMTVDAAGNLYFDSFENDVVYELSPTLLVPFNTGGTAVAGLDYSGLTASPLIFMPGQTTATITGTLPADPGAAPTLTLTIGTPNGAVVGSPATNTLTIVEPGASVTPNTAGLPINASSIVINGIFEPVVAKNTVTFNDGAVGAVTSATTTALTVTFTTPPTSLGSLTATVVSNGVSTGAPVQVATVIPVVNSMASIVAMNASTIIIHGFGFDPIAAHNIVTFSNGAIGTVISASPTQLTVSLTTAPTTTGFLTATVTTDGVGNGKAVQIATLQPTVQFSVSGENINAITGAFSVAVTLTGNPTFPSGGTSTASTFSSGLPGAWQIVFDAAGNLYTSNAQEGTINKIAPGGAVSTFASGLSYPGRIIFDQEGNLYVLCSQGSTIAKITPAGVVSTFYSNPSYYSLDSMAFDAAGNLYVGDDEGNIVKVTPTGTASTFLPTINYVDISAMTFDAAGNLYAATSPSTITRITPSGAASTFATLGYNYIAGLVFGGDGNLYVTSSYSNVVNVITPSGVVGNFITLSGTSYTGGLAFDNAGNLYVSASDYTETNTITEFSPTATVPFTVTGTALAGTDFSGITSSPLTFVNGHLTAYITGTLIPNPGNTPTLIFTLGAPSDATLNSPATNTLNIVEPPPSVIPNTAGLAINASSIVINGIFNPVVAHNSVIFNDGAVGKVTGATSTALTVALTTPPANLGTLTAIVTSNGLSTGTPIQVATVVPGVSFSNSNIGLNATTFTINGAGFDPIASHNIVILSNGDVGTVTAATSTQLTVTLTTAPTSTGQLAATIITDGNSSATMPVATILPLAQFAATGESLSATAGNFSVAATLSGNPIFAGGATPAVSTFASQVTGTNLVCDASGNIYLANGYLGTISQFTPSGVVSTFATGIYYPENMAIDNAGNLYVDSGDIGYGNTVSKVSPSGVVSTFASGLQSCAAMAVDAAGNLYVASSYLSYTTYTYVGTVYKVTPGGVVSTFASGFTYPSSLAVDAAGTLYVADSGTISKVTPGGVVTPFASGFNVPVGLTFDQAGNLYLSNAGGTTISKITPAGVVSTFVAGLSEPGGLAIDPTGNFYVTNYNPNYGETISRISPTAAVPFTIGGTAVAGVDFTNVSVGPLTFVNGQPTAYINGTLLPNNGASRTLIFTLGAPTGAVLGATNVNTLTILEPQSTTPIATPGLTSVSPGQNVSLSVAQILSQVVNAPAGDTFTLLNIGQGAHGGVQFTTTDGGHTGTVTYTPNAGYNFGDAFTYTVQDKFGATFTNTVNVTSIPSNPTSTDITNLAVQPDGSASLILSGIPNMTYGLQYKPSLSSSTWTDVGSITTNQNGAALYMDGAHPGSVGFYRLVYPAP